MKIELELELSIFIHRFMIGLGLHLEDRDEDIPNFLGLFPMPNPIFHHLPIARNLQMKSSPWRGFELHLMSHAFRKDCDDADRKGGMLRLFAKIGDLSERFGGDGCRFPVPHGGWCSRQNVGSFRSGPVGFFHSPRLPGRLSGVPGVAGR